MVTDFLKRGWVKFPREQAVSDWVANALPLAKAAVKDPAFSHWHQCEGTWFVGVDALPNDAQGRVSGSAALSGAAVDMLVDLYGPLLPLHPAQVSVVYPGYPKPREGEGDAAFGYRKKRDAAHVDGVRGIGTPKRRMVQEPHAFVLGLPLTRADEGASPLVVWEGSHEVMRSAFARAFERSTAAEQANVDVTEVYQAARKTVFETCRRVELPCQPGEALVVHRLALHGVAPWSDGAKADADGRMIAYFRPELNTPADWVELP